MNEEQRLAFEAGRWIRRLVLPVAAVMVIGILFYGGRFCLRVWALSQLRSQAVAERVAASDSSITSSSNSAENLVTEEESPHVETNRVTAIEAVPEKETMPEGSIAPEDEPEMPEFSPESVSDSERLPDESDEESRPLFDLSLVEKKSEPAEKPEWGFSTLASGIYQPAEPPREDVPLVPESEKKPSLRKPSLHFIRKAEFPDGVEPWPGIDWITMEYVASSGSYRWLPKPVMNYSLTGEQWRDLSNGLYYDFRSRQRPRTFWKPPKPKPPEHFEQLHDELPYCSLVFYVWNRVRIPRWHVNYLYNKENEVAAWRDPTSGRWHTLDPRLTGKDIPGHPPDIPPLLIPDVLPVTSAPRGIGRYIKNYKVIDGEWSFRDPLTKRYYYIRDHPSHFPSKEEPPGYQPFPKYSAENPRPDGPMFGPRHDNIERLNVAIGELRGSFAPADKPPAGVRLSPTAVRSGGTTYSLQHGLWLPFGYQGMEIPWRTIAPPRS